MAVHPGDRARRAAAAARGPALWCGLTFGGTLWFGVFPSNISRWDYDQALARWRAQGIQEYEMEVEHVCFCPEIHYQLHVVQGQLDPTRSTARDAPLSGPGETASAQRLTVEGAFARVDRLLSGNLFSNPHAIYTQVSFDSRLGYPNSITTQGTSSTHITDVDGSYTVKTLTVLKRAP
ncbi:MAG TPA: DUF6174 domain-containing protein [Chloroflexia bacterium]|nr:DUF6174 domain-containing protein [Chloroflexia bacterium]